MDGVGWIGKAYQSKCQQFFAKKYFGVDLLTLPFNSCMQVCIFSAVYVTFT